MDSDIPVPLNIMLRVLFSTISLCVFSSVGLADSLVQVEVEPLKLYDESGDLIWELTDSSEKYYFQGLEIEKYSDGRVHLQVGSIEAFGYYSRLPDSVDLSWIKYRNYGIPYKVPLALEAYQICIPVFVVFDSVLKVYNDSILIALYQYDNGLPVGRCIDYNNQLLPEIQRQYQTYSRDRKVCQRIQILDNEDSIISNYLNEELQERKTYGKDDRLKIHEYPITYRKTWSTIEQMYVARTNNEVIHRHVSYDSTGQVICEGYYVFSGDSDPDSVWVWQWRERGEVRRFRKYDHDVYPFEGYWAPAIFYAERDVTKSLTLISEGIQDELRHYGYDTSVLEGTADLILGEEPAFVEGELTWTEVKKKFKADPYLEDYIRSGVNLDPEIIYGNIVSACYWAIGRAQLSGLYRIKINFN